MTDLLAAPRGELLRLVYDLIEENQTLKIRLADLQAKFRKLQEEKSDKGKRPPSFIKANVKKKKHKAVGKKRNQGYAPSF